MWPTPDHQRRCISRLRRKTLAVGASVVALALAMAGSAGSSSSTTGTTPVSGGTATWAELPSDIPNYIFPLDSSAFNQMLYRPLYWFGTGAAPTMNTSLSLAYAPTFSGNTVTIKLKPYKWSNGQAVTAQNVMFWL